MDNQAPILPIQPIDESELSHEEKRLCELIANALVNQAIDRKNNDEVATGEAGTFQKKKSERNVNRPNQRCRI